MSDNGYFGTWSPAVINNMTSGSYLMDTRCGECATPFTLDVTISSADTPIFSITDTYCTGETTDALPNMSDNGYFGTWSPAVINNMTSGSIMDTPMQGVYYLFHAECGNT
ncbi:MAG: hypothetical protein R2795_22770 [Saprospiraceae bacterium]